MKYRVLTSDIYRRYLRGPASSSSPATAVLLAPEFKLNTCMAKIWFMSLYCHFEYQYSGLTISAFLN